MALSFKPQMRGLNRVFTRKQAEVLDYLYDHPDLTPWDLNRDTGIPLTTVIMILRDLQTQGFVASDEDLNYGTKGFKYHVTGTKQEHKEIIIKSVLDSLIDDWEDETVNVIADKICRDVSISDKIALKVDEINELKKGVN